MRPAHRGHIGKLIVEFGRKGSQIPVDFGGDFFRFVGPLLNLLQCWISKDIIVNLLAIRCDGSFDVHTSVP